MSTSANGWPAIHPNTSSGPQLRRFNIPGKHNNIVAVLPMRDGSAGFLLAFFVAFFNDRIEAVAGRILDDWGYAFRAIAGSSVMSNHASGTACDVNALKHGRGIRNTFTQIQRARIALFLRTRLRGLVESGMLWRNPDDMHFELRKGTTLPQIEKRARRLINTPRGKRICAANPGLREFILS